MFTGPGLLALADLLPVMTAYYDRGVRIAVHQQAVRRVAGGRGAKFSGGRSRRSSATGVARPAADDRPALAGERQFFAAELDHPTRGPVACRPNISRGRPGGEVSGLVCVVTDVTEQRVAERALRESEARFRRIANSAPVMMWVTRLDRVRDFVNDAYVEFVGGPDGTREEARALDWRTRDPPRGCRADRRREHRRRGSLQPFTLEGRYRRHDGEYRWLRSVSQPRFGPTASWPGSSASRPTSRWPRRPSWSFAGQVEERTRELARVRSAFRAIFDTVLEVSC